MKQSNRKKEGDRYSGGRKKKKEKKLWGLVWKGPNPSEGLDNTL